MFIVIEVSRIRSWSLAAVAGLAVTLSMSACSSGSSDKTSGKSISGQRVVAATIAPTHPQRAIPPDRQIVEVPALRKTIALTGCSAASGGWAGKGTAHNPGSVDRTYHIMVFFNDKYSRTIDYATTSVTVAPGQTLDWTAAARFTAPAGTQCVLRGLSQT